MRASIVAVSVLSNKMSSGMISGTATGSRQLCDTARLAGAVSVCFDSSGYPMTIVGTHTESIKANSHKGYIIQNVVMPDGSVQLFATYGRIGETFRRNTTKVNAEQFWQMCGEKMNVCARNMQDFLTGRGSPNRGDYKVMYVDIAANAPAPPVTQVTTLQSTTTKLVSLGAIGSSKKSSNVQCKLNVDDVSIIDPAVIRLLHHIMDIGLVNSSAAAAVKSVSVPVAGQPQGTSATSVALEDENITYPLHVIAAATRAYDHAMGIWATFFPNGVNKQYHDSCCNTFSESTQLDLVSALQVILTNVPMPLSGVSARTPLRSATLRYGCWIEIGKVLAILEQAAITRATIRDMEISAASSATNGSNATTNGPDATAAQLPLTRDEMIAVVGNMFIPGIFTTCKSTTGSVHGCALRTVHKTTNRIKADVSAMVRDSWLNVYAKLKFDILPGNDDDIAICSSFVQYANYKSFETFAIAMDSSVAKFSKFENRKTMLLVHGTDMSSLLSILNGQMDIRFCRGGRLGASRIYMADDMTKSAGYANTWTYNGRKVKAFFICQCLIPEPSRIKTIDEDLPWKHVESDTEVMIYAHSRYSLGAHLDGPTANTIKQHCSKPFIDGRSYFGENASDVQLPAKKPIDPKAITTFGNAEYTFGSNDNIIPRYLLIVDF
jgi:hypothetical protein